MKLRQLNAITLAVSLLLGSVTVASGDDRPNRGDPRTPPIADVPPTPQGPTSAPPAPCTSCVRPGA